MTNQEAIRVLNCTSLQTFCLCKVAIDGKMLSMKEAIGIAVKTLENQKTGHWIIHKLEPNGYDHIKCSVCGQFWSISDHNKIFKYCFNCGAKMRGENNE